MIHHYTIIYIIFTFLNENYSQYKYIYIYIYIYNLKIKLSNLKERNDMEGRKGKVCIIMGLISQRDNPKMANGNVTLMPMFQTFS